MIERFIKFTIQMMIKLVYSLTEPIYRLKSKES